MYDCYFLEFGEGIVAKLCAAARAVHLFRRSAAVHCRFCVGNEK